MAQIVPISPVQITQSPRGVFDDHHPPSQELMDDCVHCGFCLPTCPTYLLWNEEMDSPRGRIYLMRMGAEGTIADIDRKYVNHFDQCLGCMACMTACPSGVQYGKLIEATRAQIERNYRRPWWDRLFRRLIFTIFPHPTRLRTALLPMWLYQKLGLRWLVHKLRLTSFLPERVRSVESLLPELSSAVFYSPIPQHTPARGKRRLRVGVLLGCVQRVLFSNVNQATIRVLAALGCEVVAPHEQGCCGALMTHAGQEADAVKAARKMIDTFERANVDLVITNAAGCGSNMKEYAHLLRDDPVYASKAERFSAKCRDVTELVSELGTEKLTLHAVPSTIAFHDSCHLLHAQGIQQQPRDLLKAIPGVRLVDLPESAICCGSAGIYNLVEPVPAKQLADRKAQHVIDSGAQALVSANPGCLLQLSSALKRAGHPLPTMHIIEVIERSLRQPA